MTGFPDARGIEQLLVFIKATFELQPVLRPAAEQIEIRRVDEYNGDAEPAPPSAALKAAAEFSLLRPCTDVVLAAEAHAPSGRSVSQLDVVVAVAEREVRLRVFGERRWQDRLSPPTAAEPFTMMPIVYERAFGGAAPGDGASVFEERNPVGTGLTGSLSTEALRSVRLPNVESPLQLIRGPGDRPEPVGLGPIAPNWLPRRSYAGTYDEKWQSERAPFLAADFDARFLQVAPPALIQPSLLRGGEPIRLQHLCADASELHFTLPEVEFAAQAATHGGDEALAFSLAMVRIEPSRNRLELLYQAALPCRQGILRVREVSVALHSMKGVRA